MSELPKLPDLPPLDDLETKPPKDSTPSLSLPELPELPELPDLISNETEAKEVYSDDEGFAIEDFDDENFDEGISQTTDLDNGSEDIDLEEEWDPDEEEEWDPDELTEDDELSEDPFMSFLPPVNVDEIEITDEEIEELEEYIDEPSAPEIKKEKGRDSNELDEEAIKEFFSNLKNKILPKSKKKSGPKIKESKEGSKFTLKKLLGPIITVIVIIIIALGAKSLMGSGFSPLNELEIKASSDETHIIASNFTAEDSLNFKVKNESDSSIEMFIDITLTEESKIPFMGKKHSCSSEFIGMEVDEEREVSLDCSIDEDSQYKATIDITNTY